MDWKSAFGIPISSLVLSEEDVEQFRLERSIACSEISDEELKSLTIDESLPLLERTLLILNHGRDVQKISAVKSIRELFCICPVETLQRVMPQLYQCLIDPSTSSEVHAAAARTVEGLFADHVIDNSVLVLSFLPVILHCIHVENEDTFSLWLKVLLGVIPFLSKPETSKVLALVKSNGTLTHKPSMRRACCLIIARLAERLEEKEIDCELCPLIRALCQDVDMDVRGCMCHELKSVAPHCSAQTVQSTLLTELLELFKDEQSAVRQAALASLCGLVKFLSDEICVQTIVPLLATYYKRVVSQPVSSETVTAAQYLGPLFHELSDRLTVDCKSLLYDIYRNLSCKGAHDQKYGIKKKQSSGCYTKFRDPDPVSLIRDHAAECRRWCAFNFPALVQLCPAGSSKKELFLIAHAFSKDEDVAVRKILASCLHEVLKLVGKDGVYLRNCVKFLLKDKSVDVLDKLLTNLPVVFECLTKGAGPTYSSPLTMVDLEPVLVACERCVAESTSWRVHVKLVQAFAFLPTFFAYEHVYNKFIPLMYRILSEHTVLPVKLAAARTLLVYARYSRNLEHQREIRDRLLELAGSDTSRQRLLFLHVCPLVAEVFSRSFFKEVFYSAVMQLGSDRVVNVRLKFCSTLPLLKAQLRLPSDRLWLQNLEQTVRRVMALDKNKDVVDAIRKAALAMDEVHISLEGLPPTEEDLADFAKEQFENEVKEEHKQEQENAERGTRTRACVVLESATNKHRIGPPGSKEPSRREATASLTPLIAGCTLLKKTSRSEPSICGQSEKVVRHRLAPASKSAGGVNIASLQTPSGARQKPFSNRTFSSDWSGEKNAQSVAGPSIDVPCAALSTPGNRVRSSVSTGKGSRSDVAKLAKVRLPAAEDARDANPALVRGKASDRAIQATSARIAKIQQ